MKATPSVLYFLRLIKLFLAAGTLLALSACSPVAEDGGSVSLNLPSRAVGDGSQKVTLFVAGDYEAKKTVSLTGRSLTVEFDHIPVGSRVRVVCLALKEDNESSCYIGISDEITVKKRMPSKATVTLSNMNFLTDYHGKFYVSKPLPGCTFKWRPGSSDAPTVTTSSSEYTYSAEYIYPHMGENFCTVYCSGTEIVTLSFEEH